MTEGEGHDENDALNVILRRMQAKDTNDQLHILADRLSSIASDMAVITERQAAMTAKLVDVAKKVDTIEDMANKWRGAFILLMGLGGVTGAVMAFWDRFAKWVHPT